MLEKKRPRGVTVFAVLLAVSGVADIQQGLLIIRTSADALSEAYGAVPIFEFFRNAWWITLNLTLPIGSLTMVTVIGLVSGKRWGWHLWLLVSVLGIAMGVVNSPMGLANPLTGLIYTMVPALDITAVCYMTGSHVKAFFGKN